MRPLPRLLVRSLEQRGRDLAVLVVRLGAMGDVLRTLPPVRLLRRAAPLAKIVWVLDESWTVLVDGHPELDGVVAVPRKEWGRLRSSPANWPRLLRSILGFRSELRSRGARLLLDFHGNLRSGVIGWISGTPVRLGHAGHQQKEGNLLFTTHRAPAGDRRTPRMERNLDLIRRLGVPVEPFPPPDRFLADRGARAAAELARDRFGADRSSYAVVAPGASRSQAYKKPPSTLLVAACRALASRGLAPLVVYGPGEEEDARRVVQSAGEVAILAPPTNLPTLSALLAGAAAFVGGDSGPLHMACSVGCPVVGIYGPTDPRVNRPWAVPYRTVSPPGRRYTGIKRIDRRGGGFDGLHERHVVQAIDDLLGDSPPA